MLICAGVPFASINQHNEMLPIYRWELNAARVESDNTF